MVNTYQVDRNVTWRTATETAEILGVSRQRVCWLARNGRFGVNAFKKHDKVLNYNGVWMIPFPNQYSKKATGRPSKGEPYQVEY